MRSSYMFSGALVAAAALAAGCASDTIVTPPEVAPAIRPPAGQALFLEALATGVQIYECAPRPEQANAHAWLFRAPEAALAYRSGRAIGKHYAGPTWESTDGSKVVAGVAASDAGPNKNAIPWLLLTAKSTSGSGLFTPTKSIQRVQTTGGLAPSEPCTDRNAKAIARVPYTATYYFYR